MKVVTAQEMSEIENQAYKQGYTELDFMENAGRGVAQAIEAYIEAHQLQRMAWLLCGKGNNAGDAFVAGRYLLDKGYRVTAIQYEPLEQCSPLCRLNGKLFLERNGVLLDRIESFGTSGVIIDGIFGTGFKNKAREPYASIIEQANLSNLPILSIDIPSGLNGSTGQMEGSVIHAEETIFLGLPKAGLFLENAWNIVGKLRHVDFGLPKSFADEAPGHFHLITHEHVKGLVPPIRRNRHKYQAGYAIGIAGSPSMPGAALLSSLAAFRTGSGMVRLLYPAGMESQLSSSPPELIKIPYSAETIESMIPLLQKAGSTYIGPGLGRSQSVRHLLGKIIPSLEHPCVIDADALILYAEEAIPLPQQTIMTPHTGEMQALLQKEEKLSLSLSLLGICQSYAEKHNTTLVLKGAPTFVFHPRSPIYVNPTGDPGMATAGSGDVLTGILASLLSQGLDCHSAAILGVYLHGLSGEIAAKERGQSRGMMAGDLIEHLADAYQMVSLG